MSKVIFLFVFLFFSVEVCAQNEAVPTSNTTYYKRIGDYSTIVKKKAKFKKVVTPLGSGLNKIEFVELKTGTTRWVHYTDISGPVGLWQQFDEKGKLVSETNFDNLVYCEKKTDGPKLLDKEETDKEAEFVGGEKAMYTFLVQKMRYPAYARDHFIQGKVYAQFVILKSGKVEFKCIIGEKDPEKAYLDAETMRVINSMPDWNPAVLNGENVNMLYNLPMLFKLQ